MPEAKYSAVTLRDSQYDERSKRAFLQLEEARKKSLTAPEMDLLDQMREDGNVLKAQHVLGRVLESLRQTEASDDVQRWLWVRAHRQMLDCLADQKRTTETLPLLRRLVRSMRSQVGRTWQADVASQFERLIALNVRQRRYADALDVYEECRELVSLGEDRVRDLAGAAAQLERTDDGSVELYLSYLGMRTESSDDLRAKIVTVLRRASNVTLQEPGPDRLDAVIEHNRRAAAEDEQLVWVHANIALGCVRQGKNDEATNAAKRCVPLDMVDADAKIQLGIVYCFLEDWPASTDMFSRVREQFPDDREANYYYALSSAHHALLHPEESERDSVFRATLKDCLDKLNAAALTGPGALDGWWVRLELEAACGVEDIREADLHPPAGPLPRWRQMVAWVAALWVGGAIEPLNQWAADCAPADRHKRFLATAGEALWRLMDGDPVAARKPVEMVLQLAHDANVDDLDKDFRLAAQCMDAEIRLLTGQPVPTDLSLGEEGTAVPEMAEGSPAVRAHFHRLVAWQAILKGRFSLAIEQGKSPAHLAGPDWLITRVRAVAFAHVGHERTVLSLIRSLLHKAPDPPFHRTLAGLWHLSCEQFDPAIDMLAPLAEDLGASPDVLVACAESMCQRARVDEARECLGRAAGRAVEETPHALLFRPWRMKVPPVEWAKAPDVGHMADLCHLSGLLLHQGMLDECRPVLDRSEQLAAVSCPQAKEWLGHLLARAAGACVGKREFDRACALQSRAARYVETDAAFVEELADGMAAARPEGGAITLSDAVLPQFMGYLGSCDAEGEALGDTKPGALLMVGLHVDETAAMAEKEFHRRCEWTERAAEALPDWSWPHRNLARAAFREGDWTACLDRLGRVPEPARIGADHWLHARALEVLERFGEAAEEYDRSVQAEHRPAEATVHRGVCRTADAWVNPQEAPPEVEQFLEDLDVGALAEEDVPAETLEAATVWRGAVLTALGRCEEAADLWADFEPVTQPAAVVVALDGLAGIRLGRLDETIAKWSAAVETLPPNDDVCVLLFWASLSRPGYADREAIHAHALRLQRGNREDPLCHALRAQFAFRSGRLAEAGEAVTAMGDAPMRWRHLPLSFLKDSVARQQALVRARAALAEERFNEAADVLGTLRGDPFIEGRAALFQGIAQAKAGRIPESRQVLEPLAGSGDCDAAAVLGRIGLMADDVEAAAGWARAALALEEQHPLALLVAAEVDERQGRPADAAAKREQVASAGEHVPPALRASAHMALGRCAETIDGDRDAAEQAYRSAMTTTPEATAPVERLVCLFAGQETGPEKAADAIARFGAVPAEHWGLRGALAGAVLAERLDEPQRQAEFLAAAVRHPLHAHLDEAARRAVARWSVHLQLRLERFGEAAEALKALMATDPAPELRVLLVNCRMLEAAALLREGHIDDAVLNRLSAALDDVIAEAPDHRAAMLLAATVEVIRGNGGSPKHAEVVGRLGQEPWHSIEMQILAEVNRLFVGDVEPGRMAELLADAGLPPPDAMYLRVLTANLRCDENGLADLCRERLDEAIEQGWTLPVSASDLAIFAARTQWAAKRLPEAEAVLRKLHDAGRGTEESRALLTLVLVRVGADLLKKQRPIHARDAFVEARDVLQLTAGSEGE